MNSRIHLSNDPLQERCEWARIRLKCYGPTVVAAMWERIVRSGRSLELETTSAPRIQAEPRKDLFSTSQKRLIPPSRPFRSVDEQRGRQGLAACDGRLGESSFGPRRQLQPPPTAHRERQAPQNYERFRQQQIPDSPPLTSAIHVVVRDVVASFEAILADAAWAQIRRSMHPGSRIARTSDRSFYERSRTMLHRSSKRTFDESKHPRAPSGRPDGGQFIPASEGTRPGTVSEEVVKDDDDTHADEITQTDEPYVTDETAVPEEAYESDKMPASSQSYIFSQPSRSASLTETFAVGDATSLGPMPDNHGVRGGAAAANEPGPVHPIAHQQDEKGRKASVWKNVGKVFRSHDGLRPKVPHEFSTFEMDVAIGAMKGLWQSFYVDGLGGHPQLAYDIGMSQFTSWQNTYNFLTKTLPAADRQIRETAARYWADPNAPLLDVSAAFLRAKDFALKTGGKAAFMYRLAGEIHKLTPATLGKLMKNPEELEGEVSDEFLLMAIITQQTQAEIRELIQEANNLDAETKAYMASYVFGMVLYEAAETYATRGTDAYTKSRKFGRLLTKLDELPIIKNSPRGKAAAARLTERLLRFFDTDACFVAGTKVRTPVGLVNIEDLRPGDQVLARHEHDVDFTEPVVARFVVRTIVTRPRHLWHITVRSASGLCETVVTTACHPFFVLERSAFMAAAALETGQTLVMCDGGTLEIIDIRVQHADDGEAFTAHNLEVADAHTYHVGSSGIWVHNTGRLICELADALYDLYIKRGCSEGYARARIQGLLDDRVKRKRLTPKDAEKHFKDASKSFKGRKPVKPTVAECRKPKPNTLYESNGYYYQTDGEGRLVEASGNLRLNKADRNKHQQAKVGKSSGVPKDEGGHSIGTQFDGPGEGPLHMVPQAMNLNRGKGSEWTKLENDLAKALENGDTVVASVKTNWRPGALRPDSMTVMYEITDRRTGMKASDSKTFKNE